MNKENLYLTLVNQWTEQYRTLNSLLIQEQQSLEKRDFSLLEQLVNQKNELLNQINLDQIPALINKSGVQQLKLNQVKAYCSEHPKLAENWDSLMDLVEQCHHKNEVNAHMIELVTSATKRTFNLIKGFDPDNNIYNAKGDRTIVKHFGQTVSA